MKILVISHEYPPIGGGGANACMFLTKEFADKGHSVTILTTKYQNQPEETTENGVKIYRVKCLRKKVENSNFIEMFTFLLGAYIKADELEKKEKYDVCLVFFGIPSGPIALHLKNKYKLPYVIRSGGGDIPGTQKRYKYIYMLLGPVLRKIWKESSEIIANSQGLRDRALAFEDRYLISVIENGVDTSFFEPGEKRDEQGTVRLLFVSRLIERKGLQFIIPKLKDISEKVYKECGKRIELVVVGDGPYRQQLESIAVQTECSKLIKFEGQKNKQEVKEYYKNSDIFLLPSMWEGMPNVVLEAMACGLPIIMTPCEGSKELIKGNGVISPIEKFEDNIVTLCVDEAMRNQFGKKSLELIKNNFEWKAIAERYLDTLQKYKV